MDSSNPPRVMVVAEDQSLRESLGPLLARMDLRVELLAEPQEARTRLEASLPDLLLLQMDAANRNLELCRLVRSRSQHLPVLFLTPSAEDAWIEKGSQAGATDFLPTPVPEAVLGHRVRHALASQQALLELEQSQARLLRAQHIAQLGPTSCTYACTCEGECECKRCLSIAQLGATANVKVNVN